MASDTKRGAVISAIRERGFSECDADVVLEALAARGLHVVTAAEKAVLDAVSKLTTDQLEWWMDPFPVDQTRDVGAAELARRAAASDVLPGDPGSSEPHG